jgi:hypothetical protein
VLLRVALYAISNPEESAVSLSKHIAEQMLSHLTGADHESLQKPDEDDFAYINRRMKTLSGNPPSPIKLRPMAQGIRFLAGGGNVIGQIEYDAWNFQATMAGGLASNRDQITIRIALPPDMSSARHVTGEVIDSAGNALYVLLST